MSAIGRGLFISNPSKAFCEHRVWSNSSKSVLVSLSCSAKIVGVPDDIQ